MTQLFLIAIEPDVRGNSPNSRRTPFGGGDDIVDNRFPRSSREKMRDSGFGGRANCEIAKESRYGD